jgi:hypothetical protein
MQLTSPARAVPANGIAKDTSIIRAAQARGRER